MSGAFCRGERENVKRSSGWSKLFWISNCRASSLMYVYMTTFMPVELYREPLWIGMCSPLGLWLHQDVHGHVTCACALSPSYLRISTNLHFYAIRLVRLKPFAPKQTYQGSLGWQRKACSKQRELALEQLEVWQSECKYWFLRVPRDWQPSSKVSVLAHMNGSQMERSQGSVRLQQLEPKVWWLWEWMACCRQWLEVQHWWWVWCYRTSCRGMGARRPRLATPSGRVHSSHKTGAGCCLL